VTVEPIEGDDSHVKLTPWVEGVGCLCHFSMNIPKDSIESVEPTGDVHHCCGKQLRVVTVSFKKGAQLDLATVVADLVSKASSAEHSTPAHTHHQHPQHGHGYVGAQYSAASPFEPLGVEYTSISEYGLQCPAGQYLMVCAGQEICRPPGHTCCGFVTCPPGQYCMVCRGQQICRPVGSVCCGYGTCPPGQRCVICNSQEVCRGPGQPC